MVTQSNTYHPKVCAWWRRHRGEIFLSSNAMYHPRSSHPHIPPFAPCPAALSCLCSHHNKPGADGALLCLADSDRQPLSANSLSGHQLTGLDSARCFYHFSSPSVGGAGRRRWWRRWQSGGISRGDKPGRWWVAVAAAAAAGWRSLCRPHHASLRGALGLIGYTSDKSL